MAKDQLNKQLFEAVKANDIKEVKKAIKDGADINATDKYGKTPLHRAARNGYAEIAKLLIEYGAEVDHQDKYRQTPLHLASNYKYNEISKMLLEKGAYLMIQEELNHNLWIATMHGQLEEAKKLIEKGADVNFQDRNEITTLSLAEYNLELAQNAIQELVELRDLLEQHGGVE